MTKKKIWPVGGGGGLGSAHTKFVYIYPQLFGLSKSLTPALNLLAQ